MAPYMKEGRMATDLVPRDVLLLLDHPEVLAEGRAARARYTAQGHPVNDGGDGDDTGDDAGDDDGTGDDANDAAGSADGEGDDAVAAGGEEKKEPDWKAMARKHEARSKKLDKELKAERDARAAREAAELTEHEKAIKDAKEAGRAEALTEAEKTRRSDKIEVAVTRIAGAKGVTIGTGDTAQTVKFSDPEDVQMWLDRQIANGNIDIDDIYTDGKVDADALADVLRDLAAEKPNWLADKPAGGPARKPAGESDAGRGKGAAPDLDSMSPEDHAKRKGRLS